MMCSRDGRRGAVPGLAAVIVGILCALQLAQPPRAGAQAAPGEHFAVIVHPSTPLRDLRLLQLRRMFRGEQQFWPGGIRVVLFVGAPGSASRALALRHLYRMDEAEFNRYWIGKIFRDAVPAGPKILSSVDMTMRLTARIPGAIAVVPASEVDRSVRVLSIDGRFPGSEGYPLVEGAP